MAQEGISTVRNSTLPPGFHYGQNAIIGERKDSFLVISPDSSLQPKSYNTDEGDSTSVSSFHTGAQDDTSSGSTSSPMVLTKTNNIAPQSPLYLSAEEQELLDLLEQMEVEETKVTQQKFEKLQPQEAAVRVKPILVRTETQEIKYMYQKNNLSGGDTFLHQKEPIHSTQHSFEHFPFNDKERSERDYETSLASSHRLLDKTAYKHEKQNVLYYRPSLSTDFQAHLDLLFMSASENDYGYKKIPLGGKDFYVTSATIQKPLYKPVEEPRRITQGKTEKMIAMDDHFVALERHAHRDSYSPQEQHDMQTRLDLFQEHPCIVKAWVVDSRLIIAENGGTNVRKLHVQEDSKIQLKQYKPFLEFVTELHKRGGRLCCVSNDNLLCPNDNGSLNFTGWKYIATQEVGKFDEAVFDKYIYTQSLIDKINEKSELEERKKWMEVAEKHALLLMVCEGTSPRLASRINAHSTRECPKTKLTAENQNEFLSWVSQKVKAGNRKDVILFLKDPVKNPLKPAISEVLKF